VTGWTATKSQDRETPINTITSMRFTFDQLESFVAVAEEEHFGRAAARLHITQPPLSRQVQTLEKHLQASLFDRRGRRARLTAAGAAFLVEARRLLSAAADAEDIVRRIAEGSSGTVRVGFTSVVGNATLPSLFRRATRLVPGVRIALHEVRTPKQAEALLAGRIDIALGRKFELTDDLVSRPLPPDELVMVTRSDFLDAAADDDEAVSLAQLNGRDFVMYAGDDPHHVHDVVVSALTANDVHPHTVQRTMEVYMMLSLVDAGVGAAIVPRSALNWAGRNTRVVETRELRGVLTHSFAVWRRDSTNPAIAQLLGTLEDLDRDEVPA
jgi:DNA-binding transcriptional LysR family regulator